ncbi:hypothetical protein BDV06DRAFT_227645 [Aspergillus oleicola]
MSFLNNNPSIPQTNTNIEYDIDADGDVIIAIYNCSPSFGALDFAWLSHNLAAQWIRLPVPVSCLVVNAYANAPPNQRLRPLPLPRLLETPNPRLPRPKLYHRRIWNQTAHLDPQSIEPIFLNAQGFDVTAFFTLLRILNHEPSFLPQRMGIEAIAKYSKLLRLQGDRGALRKSPD